MAEAEQRRGLAASLSRIGQSLLALAENRFQLFTSEFESEKLRFLDTLLKLAIALAVVGVGLSLATLTLALFVWRAAGYAGLVGMAAVFLVAGGLLLMKVRNEMRRSPPPFEKTLNEFRKDRQCSTGKD